MFRTHAPKHHKLLHGGIAWLCNKDMSSSTTKIVEFLLRQGVIPLCSGGASICFALYSAKIAHAANLWESSLLGNDDLDASSSSSNMLHHHEISLVHRYYRESVHQYVMDLRRHSGAIVWMSLTTAAMAVEAYKDWQYYATPSNTTWKDISLALWQRQRPLPFFLRSSVLLTSAGSLIMSHQLYPGVVLRHPEPPMYYNQQ
jgi:hypothetical protein